MCSAPNRSRYGIDYYHAKASVDTKQCCNAPHHMLRMSGCEFFMLLQHTTLLFTVRLLSQGPELNEEQREQEAQWGPPRGDPTQWASCLRVVDPSTLESASVLELDNNEAALSMCCVRFTGGEDFMLAVGTVQNLGFYPRAADGVLSSPCYQLWYHCLCLVRMKNIYCCLS